MTLDLSRPTVSPDACPYVEMAISLCRCRTVPSLISSFIGLERVVGRGVGYGHGRQPTRLTFVFRRPLQTSKDTGQRILTLVTLLSTLYLDLPVCLLQALSFSSPFAQSLSPYTKHFGQTDASLGSKMRFTLHEVSS